MSYLKQCILLDSSACEASPGLYVSWRHEPQGPRKSASVSVCSQGIGLRGKDSSGHHTGISVSLPLTVLQTPSC